MYVSGRRHGHQGVVLKITLTSCLFLICFDPLDLVIDAFSILSSHHFLLSHNFPFPTDSYLPVTQLTITFSCHFSFLSLYSSCYFLFSVTVFLLSLCSSCLKSILTMWAKWTDMFSSVLELWLEIDDQRYRFWYQNMLVASSLECLGHFDNIFLLWGPIFNGLRKGFWQK